jgi:hypothetical protein
LRSGDQLQLRDVDGRLLDGFVEAVEPAWYGPSYRVRRR